MCHGPAALVDMTLSDGSYLIAGKQVTGFTNGEEQNLGRYPWLRRATPATLDRFERTNPQNFHTWKLLGEYYRSQGDDVRAAQCFDKALQSGIPRTDEREAVERLKSECKP